MVVVEGGGEPEPELVKLKSEDDRLSQEVRGASKLSTDSACSRIQQQCSARRRPVDQENQLFHTVHGPTPIHPSLIPILGSPIQPLPQRHIKIRKRLFISVQIHSV